MRVIHFLLDLITGQANLVGVDDHHVVAGIEIRRKTGVIFADQNAGHLGGEASQNHVGCVDYKPVGAYFEGFCFLALGYVRPH